MPADTDSSPTRVAELAVNLDDTTGEILGDALQQLLDDGALDVWTAAISMKHSRPGVCLSVLCTEDDRDRLAKRILELTGSFGVRFRSWDRLVLDRKHVTASTPLGDVRLKIGSLDGKPIIARPEFADVQQLARDNDVTPRRAQLAADAAAQRWMRQHGDDAT